MARARELDLGGSLLVVLAENEPIRGECEAPVPGGERLQTALAALVADGQLRKGRAGYVLTR